MPCFLFSLLVAIRDSIRNIYALIITLSCSRRPSLPQENSRPEPFRYLIRYHDPRPDRVQHELNIYHKTSICIGITRLMRDASWKRSNADKKMFKCLSLLTACTPSLTMDIPDDRAVASRAAKDSHCCMWQPKLLPKGCSQHRVKGKSTCYLNVVIGRAGCTAVKEKAHRLMCYSLHGPPPPNQPDARHICNNKGGRCINPYHVVWSNQQENNHDVAELKRKRSAKRRRAS